MGTNSGKWRGKKRNTKLGQTLYMARNRMARDGMDGTGCLWYGKEGYLWDSTVIRCENA
jgi:hypothetical protein